MKPTFVTQDFSIYFFDKNPTEIRDVLQISVEELVKNCSLDSVMFVSNSNSLGFMDGGSDLGYCNAIPDIQSLVQHRFKLSGQISQLGRPMLNIGCSMVFKLQSNVFFCSSPTMFLPQKVNETKNPYYSFISSLRVAKKLNIKHVFAPMMCTGYGGMTYIESYNLMQNAVHDYDSKLIPGTFWENGSCTFYKPGNFTTESIISSQPKVYMNTEFGLSISELIESQKTK